MASTSTRPYNSLVILGFTAIALIGLYLTIIETCVLNGLLDGFRAMVKANDTFPNGTPIIKELTGVKSIDEVVAYIAVSFVPGAQLWDLSITLQQLHLLVQLSAVVAVLNVEAYRVRNVGSLISRQPLWVLLYQTLSGALMVPVLCLCSLLRTSEDSHFSSGRAVPLRYAKGLLPAVILGYLVPSIALYVPWDNIKLTSILAVVWQPSPVYVNILLFVFSFISSSAAPAKNASQIPPDVGYLKTVYRVVGVVCLVNHLNTLLLCFASGDWRAMLSDIFIPDKSRWKNSIAASLQYIFQMDYFFIFGGSLAWAWVSMADVRRLAPGSKGLSAQEVVWDAVKILHAAVALGPGTVMCIVWHWREDKMVLIEQSADTKKST